MQPTLLTSSMQHQERDSPLNPSGIPPVMASNPGNVSEDHILRLQKGNRLDRRNGEN